MHNTIPYIVSGLFSASSFISQTAPGQPSQNVLGLAQAGMYGVVVLLLLKFFPMIYKSWREEAKANREAMRCESEANRAIIREIVEKHDKQNTSWQVIIAEKGVCLKDKNGN